MEKVKPGYKTTEFWVTTGTNIALAIVAILAMRGLMSREEGELWVQLVSAVLVAIVPVGMALATASYSQSRAKVKAASNGN